MEDHHSSTNFEVWTLDEDDAIIKVIHESKMSGKKLNWNALFDKIPQHSPLNIVERWEMVLDPVAKSTDWSMQEKWLLYILRGRRDMEWTDLLKYLIGRSESSILEYWNSNIICYMGEMERPLQKHFQ